MRLEHANITVENIDTSFQFYSALFGFEKRWEGMATGEVGPIRAVHAGNGHTYLALFEAERKGRRPADYGIAGVNHIGFEVDDLEKWKAQIKGMGLEIISKPGVIPIKFRAPGGHIAEVAPARHFDLEPR